MNIANKTVLLFVCLLIIGVDQVVTAQSEYLFETEHHQRISVDVFGNIKTSQYSTMNILIFRGQELLREESIQQELELVDSQVKELDAFYESIDEKRREYVKRIGQKPLTPTQRDEVREYKSEMHQRLDDILLPFQSKRFEEIERYLALQTVGLSRFLETDEKLSELKGTFRKSDVARVIREKSEWSAQESKKRASEIVDDVFSLLSKKQREKVEEIVGSSCLESLNLELLLLDFTNSERQEHQSRQTMSFVDLLKGMGEFDAGPDGVWRRKTRKGFPEDVIYLELAYMLRSNPQAAPELMLSEQQHVELNQLVFGFEEEMQLAKQSYHERVEAAPQSEMREIHKENQKTRSRMRKKLQKDFLAIVPEHQLQRMSERLFRSNLFSNGVVSELVANTWLHEKIGIGTREVELLRKKIPELQRRVEEELEELGLAAAKQILAEVSGEIRSEVLTTLKGRPESLSPSLIFLK